MSEKERKSVAIRLCGALLLLDQLWMFWVAVAQRSAIAMLLILKEMLCVYQITALALAAL